jgi:hypothetical protein
LLNQYASSEEIPEGTAWHSQLQEHVFTNPKTLLQLLIDRHQNVRIFIPPEDLREGVCFFAITGSALRNMQSCLRAAVDHPVFLEHPALLHVLHLNTVFIEQYVGKIFGVTTISNVEAFGHGVNLRGRFVATLRSHIFYTFRNPPVLTMFDVLPPVHQNTNIAFLNEKHILQLSEYFEQNDQPTWLAYATITPPLVRGIDNTNWLAKVPEILAYIQTLTPQDKEVPLRLFIYSYLLNRLTNTVNYPIREHALVVLSTPLWIGRTDYHSWNEGFADFFIKLEYDRSLPLIIVNDIKDSEFLFAKLRRHGIGSRGSISYAQFSQWKKAFWYSIDDMFPHGVCLVADAEGIYLVRTDRNRKLSGISNADDRILNFSQLTAESCSDLRYSVLHRISYAIRRIIDG